MKEFLSLRKILCKQASYHEIRKMWGKNLAQDGAIIFLQIEKYFYIKYDKLKKKLHKNYSICKWETRRWRWGREWK